MGSSRGNSEPKVTSVSVDVLEVVPLWGKNKFNPYPQNEILVPLCGGSFKIPDQRPSYFYSRDSSGPAVLECV